MPVSAPIVDFRGGLDTRKMNLTLPAGTLTFCDNAHINQGAEIEKRKAFIQNAIPYTSTFPTFGMCATPAGMVIFGSGSLSAGVAPNSVTPGAFPSPMVYQMVVHPAVLAGVTYVNGTHNITSIVSSTLFGNFAFAVAKFADGLTTCYYNGTLVTDFIAGVVLQYIATNGAASLATALASLVNSTDNYTANAAGALLDAFSLPGASYSASVDILSASNVSVATAGNINYPTATVSNDTGNNPSDGSTVTIGGQIYRFKNTMVQVFDIQIAASAVLTLKNLYLAIGATGTGGTNYCAGTTANTAVIASAFQQTPFPSFSLTGKTLLANGVVENPIPGVTLEETNPTSFGTAYGTPSQGQFQIVAGLASTVGTNTITSSGQPANNSTITIGTTVYKFVSSLNSGAAYYVLIQSSAALTLASLVKAINATGIAASNGTTGADYFTGTLANPNVSAVLTDATHVGLTSIQAGATVSIPTNSTSGTTNLAFTFLTMTGGVTSGITSIIVGPTFANGKITTNGTNPANNSTLTIGIYTYTFVTTLPGSPVEGSLLIGATIGDTMQTLINAINGTGTYGLDNQVSFEHEQVSAVPTTQQGAVVVIARGAGTTGNNVALSTGGTTNLTVPATLTNGAGVINTPNSGQQLLAATVQYPFNVTAAQYAALVSNAINQNSGVSGFNALAKNQTVFLYSVGSNSFADNAVVTVTTTGQVAIGTCAFSFVQNKIGGGSVNSVSVDNNSLLPAAISLGSNTLAQLLVLVSNAINANTAASNELNLAGAFYAINAYFVALSIGNTLYISQIQTASTDAALAASATPDGTYITASSSNIQGFSASVPSSLSIAHYASYIPNTPIPEVIAVCSASGGYSPYSYLWQNNARSPQISIVSGASSNTVIIQNTYLTIGFIQGFTCTVTDSLGNKAVSNLLSITTV